jgi:hypothetical protein
MSKERALLRKVCVFLDSHVENDCGLISDIRNLLAEPNEEKLSMTQRLEEYKKGYARAEEDLRGKTMTKEQALRILKLLSGLEMYVFMQSNVPDHHTDELIKIIGDLTDIVLEKENEN